MIKKKQKKKIERTEAKNKERKGYLGIEIADISCGILISLGGVLAQQIGPNSRSDSSGHAFYSLLLLLLLLAALSLWFPCIYLFIYQLPPPSLGWIMEVEQQRKIDIRGWVFPSFRSRCLHWAFNIRNLALSISTPIHFS